ncbi:hypothetical protein CY35_06G077100 [Sphagnum magellanicum]|nr:hypothetical protein CY35_06G077100 [Sphagnum magellanicum]
MESRLVFFCLDVHCLSMLKRLSFSNIKICILCKYYKCDGEKSVFQADQLIFSLAVIWRSGSSAHGLIMVL